MSTRQTARKVKKVQASAAVVRYADGLITLGHALKNPETSIREIASLALDVGLRLEFALLPQTRPSSEEAK